MRIAWRRRAGLQRLLWHQIPIWVRFSYLLDVILLRWLDTLTYLWLISWPLYATNFKYGVWLIYLSINNLFWLTNSITQKYNHFSFWLTFFYDRLLSWRDEPHKIQWSLCCHSLHLDDIDHQHFNAAAGWRTSMSGTDARSFYSHWPSMAKSSDQHSLARTIWSRLAWCCTLARPAILVESIQHNRHNMFSCSQSVESRLHLWSDC